MNYLPSSAFAGVSGNFDQIISNLPNNANAVSTFNTTSSTVFKTDTRARLRAMYNQRDVVYGKPTDDNILSILHPDYGKGTTDGLLFPYTPSIQVNQSVDYSEVKLTHVNGDINAYSRTPSVSLSITGKFTVQNQREGRYLLAVLHFLRTASKMYFGEKDSQNKLAGLPPPVLLFTGYGNYMFNDLPVIIKSHGYQLDDTVDLIDIETYGGVARLPALLNINIELAVQQTPKAMRTKFSLDEFRTGALMRNGNKGWI